MMENLQMVEEIRMDNNTVLLHQTRKAVNISKITIREGVDRRLLGH